MRVTNLIDSVSQHLPQVWTKRAAPDDNVEYAVFGHLMAGDDDDELAPCLTVFLSVDSPEVADGAAASLLLVIPIRVVTTTEMRDFIANQMWERVQVKRMALALGLDDGDDGWASITFEVGSEGD